MIMAVLLLALTQQLQLSKSFPGSAPPYAEVRIDAEGNAEYREDPKDENPLRFQIDPSDTGVILALAEKLDYFARPVESGLKVANMGQKTFSFQKGVDKHEVKFNYSEDVDARALLDWFERICESERNLINLERTAKYDKLGVQDALLQVEISWDRKRLVAPQQMLPMLDRISKNESYMHMARNRAAKLAENIRAAK